MSRCHAVYETDTVTRRRGDAEREADKETLNRQGKKTKAFLPQRFYLRNVERFKTPHEIYRSGSFCPGLFKSIASDGRRLPAIQGFMVRGCALT
jgi:hypothetical protein